MESPRVNLTIRRSSALKLRADERRALKLPEVQRYALKLRSSGLTGVGSHKVPRQPSLAVSSRSTLGMGQSAAFRQQPRDRGAQLGDAFAAARRGEDRLRKGGGTFVHEGERGGEAAFSLGGFHLVLLRQDDLIGHRGGIEKIEHLNVDRFCAMTAIDEKKHAQQRHPPRKKSPISWVQDAVFSFDAAAWP